MRRDYLLMEQTVHCGKREVAADQLSHENCKGHAVSQEGGKTKLPVLKTTSLVSEALEPCNTPLPSSSKRGAILASHRCGFRHAPENMARGLLFHVLCRKQEPAVPVVLRA